MRLRLLCTVSSVTLLCGPALVLASPAASASTAATYYLSPSGNDQADGQSLATAWRTLGRSNSQQFVAGDTLLLQGGSRFAGMLYFDASDAGTPAAPITIGSFGTGRAAIDAAGSQAVLAYDTAGLTISDLDLHGDASAFATKGGVTFYSDLPAGQRRAGVTLNRLSVTGFRNGIEIGGANQGAGFSSVRINDSTLYGNRDAGLVTYGPTFDATHPGYANADVQVARTDAYSNLGNSSDTVHNSGNGIVLGSVAGGGVTSSRAWGNGSRCKAPEGPAGIWTYDSDNIRIADNQSYSNRTGGTADGDGFDLDQNVSRSTLTHNASRDNDGAGYLLYTGASNAAQTGNVVSGNSSYGDARKNSWYGGITVAGRVFNATVTGNLVDTTTSASHAPALAVRSAVVGLDASANTLTSGASYAILSSTKVTTSSAYLHGNTWPSTVRPVLWGSKYPSVSAWRVATGMS
jgi:hypothetical protein